MTTQFAQHWINPRTRAIGLAGFSFGFLLLGQGDLAYELFTLFLYRDMDPDQVASFHGPEWALSSWFLVIPLALAFLTFVIGTFGSAKLGGYPAYFVALLVSLVVAIAGVSLVPMLTSHLNEYIIELLTQLVLAETAFLGLLLLSIAIACGERREHLPQIFVCFGAVLLGSSLWYLQTVHPFELNLFQWLQMGVFLPLLISLVTFYQSRNYYQLNAPTQKRSPFKQLLNSPLLWQIILIQFLLETAFQFTQSFPLGNYASEIYEGFWFLLAVSLLFYSGTIRGNSATTTSLLVQTIKASFLLVLSWTAFKHLGYPTISQWSGFLGSGAFYLASLGVLGWYILTIEKTNGSDDKANYPVFLLILLIAEGAPRVMFLGAVLLTGASTSTPINEISDLIGFLATALLLFAVLAWVPKKIHDDTT